MENPMTWTPTIRLLNSCYHPKDGSDAGTQVLNALKENSLLKESSPVLDKALVYIINKAYEHQKELAAAHFCGRSFGGTLNDLLAEIGAI